MICPFCTGPLIINRWRMTKARIALVHALARDKGLDRELYKLRLKAIGVDNCKELSADGFNQFISGLRRLPNAR